MRAFTATLAAIALAGSAAAQTPPANGRTFMSAADLDAMIAGLKANGPSGEAPFPIGRALDLPPYRVNVEYRSKDAPMALHERDAEIFYVLEGSGVFTSGGKLVNPERRDPANLFGAAIEGGQVRKVAKGDAFIVPENTPHGFSGIEGELVLMSVHIPRPVAAPWR